MISKKVTPIRPVPVNDGSAYRELDKLTGYSGMISGTVVDEALDEQRDLIHEAQAIIVCAGEYISHITKDEEKKWPPQLALDAAFKMLDRVHEALDAGNIEDRGLAIARARLDERKEAST